MFRRQRGLLTQCIAALLALSAVACGPAPRPAKRAMVVPPAPPKPTESVRLSAEAPAEALAFIEHLPSSAVEHAIYAVSGERISLSGSPLPGDLDQLRVEGAPEHSMLYLDSSPLRLTPRRQEVRAVALSSLPAASEALSRLADAGNATLSRQGPLTRVSPRFGPDCLLGKSAEGARIVCGPDPALLRSAGHLLVRKSQLQAGSPTKVLVNIPVRRLEERFGSLLSKGRALLPIMAKSELERRGNSAARLLGPVVGDLTREGLALFGDTEQVELHMTDKGGDVDVTATVQLRGAKGWLAGFARDAADQRGPRGAFDRLPNSAEFALFSAGLPERGAREMEVFTARWLRAIFGAGYRESTELIAKTFLPDVGFAYAHGDALGRDARAMGYGGERIREKTRSVWGWHVLSYEEDPKVYAQLLKRGMDTYNGGELRRLSYAQLPRLCKGLPKITHDPPPKRLPAGSERFAMTFPGKFFDACGGGQSDGVPAKQSALVVLLAPQATRSWIGVSVDEAGLVHLLEQSLGGTGTLRLDGALKPLQDPTAVLGGFVTLRGIAGLRRNAMQHERRGGRRQRLDQLPNRGQTRIPWKLSVKKASPATVTAWVRLPNAAVQDMRAGRDRLRRFRGF